MKSQLIILILALIGLSEQACSPQFEAEFLAKHNQYRDEHGVPLLTLNSNISASAQKCADQIATSGHFVACQSTPFGENLYQTVGTGSDQTSGKAPVEAWYDPVTQYHFFGHEPPIAIEGPVHRLYGSFTQVVWKGTKELGVACAAWGEGTQRNFVVIGFYSPAGNVNGHFTENVNAAVK